MRFKINTYVNLDVEFHNMTDTSVRAIRRRREEVRVLANKKWNQGRKTEQDQNRRSKNDLYQLSISPKNVPGMVARK